MALRVVHIDEDHDHYIGRGSLWGNPFTVKEYGRQVAIELYRSHLDRLLKDPEVYEAFRQLDGRLGCHCKPLPCHGDVIVERHRAEFG